MIVDRVDASRIGGVISHLIDIAIEVAARIDQFERPESPVECPCRIFELILVARFIVLLHVQIAERGRIGVDAVGLQRLVALLQ
jgi:hypothetical protein